MESYSGTIGDELDRLEVKAGKIGMNSREQAYALLHGLDQVYRGMETISNEQSRKVVEVQFGGIVARMQREAGLMLRDLGGRSALIEAREQVHPPKDHAWWYLDQHQDNTRQVSLRRTVTTGGIILAVLLVLGVIYQVFLAPDPQVAARYGFEQSARDLLMRGEWDSALVEVEQGLLISPQDPVLTTLKGVITEQLGHADEAKAVYDAAMRLFEQPHDFYVTRGQAYTMANLPDLALIDAQEAIRLSPDSPEAYLLAGQAHEMLAMYGEAMNDYEQAYAVADAANKLELAALARMRTAMLMQFMGRPDLPGLEEPTATP